MYYLVIIQNAGYEGSAQAVYRYDNLGDALAAYHSELAYRNESRHLTTCAILDYNGFVIYRDVWEVPKEPEVQEEQ